MVKVVWRYYANVAGIFAIALLLTAIILETTLPDDDQPVVVIEKFDLLTPRVPVGGDVVFRTWRKSNESCPGAGVIAFTSNNKDEGPVSVISARYPLGSPGYNSPPPLTITRELPRSVGPGKWTVRTGVDSVCPTRTRFDVTGEFEIEVY